MSDTSVIIPTLNSVRFLKASIDSVVAQTSQAKEIIVVDGGSTDTTERICNSYGEKVTFLRQTGKGVGNAMNEGIRASSGRWFKIQDSDDLLSPRLIRLLEVRASMEPKPQVVYGDYVMVDGHGQPARGESVPPKSEKTFLAALWRRNVVSHMSAIVERSAFEEVGEYDEELGMAEDYDWMLRAAFLHHIRFAYIPLVLSAYRIHGGNLSSKNARAEGKIAEARAKMEMKIRGASGLGASVASVSYRLLCSSAKRLPRGRVAKTRLEMAAPRFFDRWYWAATRGGLP